MDSFSLFLGLGWRHILDLSGYDHILFIAALASVYTLPQWRNLMLLVTAFTLGHSLTLLLTTLNVIYLPTELVEFLIPLTIAITCISNWSAIKSRPHDPEPNFLLRYLYAFLFGLIHGMGFSGYLIQMLSTTEDLAVKILAFNVGLEMGQILVVAGVTAVVFMLLMFTKLKHRDLNLVLSSIILGLSLHLIIERASALNTSITTGNFRIFREAMPTDSLGRPASSPFGSTDSTVVNSAGEEVPSQTPAEKPLIAPSEGTIDQAPTDNVVKPGATPNAPDTIISK